MTRACSHRWTLAVCALALLALPAWAAHPIFSEDPGTVGAGSLELELGLAALQGDPTINGRGVAFNPQLSVGITPSIDLIVQTAWLNQNPAHAPTLIGSGDVLLDGKWRFYQGEVVALAVRAGLDLPTGDSATGLGAGALGYHAIAVASVTFGRYAAYANAGYAHTRQPATRANLGVFSLALTRPADTPLQSFIEVAAYSNPDPGNPQWPAFARTGVIYSVATWLDVDAGFQARLNRSATRAVWLAGATLRW
ncbi:MAG: hypothetical protein ABI624_09470 [Casimicrobiaceae bacterium]